MSIANELLDLLNVNEAKDGYSSSKHIKDMDYRGFKMSIHKLEGFQDGLPVTHYCISPPDTNPKSDNNRAYLLPIQDEKEIDKNVKAYVDGVCSKLKSSEIHNDSDKKQILKNAKKLAPKVDWDKLHSISKDKANLDKEHNKTVEF